MRKRKARNQRLVDTYIAEKYPSSYLSIYELNLLGVVHRKEAMRAKLTPENYDSEVFWVKLGRTILAGLGVLLVMGVLAGPAIGWWVDTRIYPGLPDEKVQVFDAAGNVVDEYVDDEDSHSTTLWLLMPYSIYGGILLVGGSIILGVRIKDAQDTLGMDSPFDTLPPNPRDKLALEAENAAINQAERDARKSPYNIPREDPKVYTGEVLPPIPGIDKWSS